MYPLKSNMEDNPMRIMNLAENEMRRTLHPIFIGFIAFLGVLGCGEKSSSFIESTNVAPSGDTQEESDTDEEDGTVFSKDSGSTQGEDTLGGEEGGNEESADTLNPEEDAQESTEEGGNSEEEDTSLVITEDGGVGGSGIYPPKEIPDLLGGDRPAQVVVPLDYDEENTYPLVLNLHGYTGTSEQIDNYFNLSAYVSSRGFILVTPDGTIDEGGYPFWNAPDCCNQYGSEVDDLGYLKGLIEEAKESLSVDADRVYVIGLSNGAFMAHYLACQEPQMIAGIAALAGVSPKKPANCNPESSVGVLQIHGTLDSVIPYDGTFFYNSAEQTVANWRKHNACDETIVNEDGLANYDYLVQGDETVKTSWNACGSGNSVSLWALQLSAHVPYLHPDFTPDVLDWLFSQTNNSEEL